MKELGSSVLAVSNPGESKCCIVVESDEVQKVMNISRSGLIDDPLTNLFYVIIDTGFRNRKIKPEESDEISRASQE